MAGEVVTVGAFESASASPNSGELSKFAEFRKAPSTFQLSSDFAAFFLISESAVNFPTFAVSLLTQPFAAFPVNVPVASVYSQPVSFRIV